ncbi:MAG: helix-turn-helix domain-containing protein [Marvinbryantia sp.]|uniref:helix-turn-helix domain-containing protein n=1 Tax=Marvinbryantia sp. TaxID=2496532 RepID=UPI00399B0FDD
MIRYDRLWKTMKEKGISQYDLIYKYGVDKAQLQRLRKNMVLKTITLDRLCEILDCRIEDIMEYIPNDTVQ